MTIEEILDRVEELYELLRKKGVNEERFPVDSKRTSDWKLIADTDDTRLFLPDQLRVVPFLNRDELAFGINSRELIRRAKKMQANLGYSQARYLLKHRGEMPEEWNEYTFVFPGTIWYDEHYCLRISKFSPATLISYAYYSSSFDDRYRLLCPRHRK